MTLMEAQLALAEILRPLNEANVGRAGHALYLRAVCKGGVPAAL